ncbi:helix-turn-helix transcriptional regulator [Tenacibaculum ovolyticum]|uniref:helix-turn-helix domain-containing protein n=1 Tax=Tenacibaculum ovolyticum TaxID=104270 RepID=UPI0022F3C838|nr:helix-turn-helix transcriptional regulator [Tenacibaculum ovolyticum]WBX78324.1 helix-turn-helix transcriptional regulator [Tenacibaculum ovolyticum]
MRLSIIRKNKGETQKQLADVLNVSLRTIQNYEKGSVTIPNEKLKQIVSHYKVNLTDIFEESDKSIDLHTVNKSVISEYIVENWEYMMENNLFNANFKAKAGEWAISVKKNN